MPRIFKSAKSNQTHTPTTDPAVIKALSSVAACEFWLDRGAHYVQRVNITAK